jgi:hypothetical protein
MRCGVAMPTVPASLKDTGLRPKQGRSPGAPLALTVGLSHHRTSEGRAQDHID